MGTALLAALVLSVVTERFMQRHELQQAQSRLGQLGTQLQARLEHGLVERAAEMQALADAQWMRSLMQQPQRLRNALETVQQATPALAWIGLADRQGHVLAATGKLLEGADVSEHPWFVAGFSEPWIGDVHVFHGLTELLPQREEPWRFIDLAAPVVLDGGTRAVLGAHLSWDWVRELERQVFTNELHSQGVEAFIVQDSGKVLLGPAGTVGKVLGVATLGAASASGRSVTEWPGEGDFVTAVVAPRGRGSAGELGWTMVVRQRPQVALHLANYDELRRQLFGSALLVTLLMALAAPLMSDKLAAPLVQLANWLRNPNSPPRPAFQRFSYREAQWLLEALLAMRERNQRQAAELTEANAALEERVNARTQELRRSTEVLQTVADNLPTLVALVGADLRYQFVNQTYRQWWGVDPKGLVGQSIRQLLGEQQFTLLKPQIERALAGERSTAEHFLTQGGQQRYVEVTYVPYNNHAGQADGFMVVVYDITARKQLELQLAREAHHDALTGLPNRRHVMDLLALTMLRTQRMGSPLALLYLDLDGFKALHDRHGHEAGDAVLKTVAQRLRRCVRRTDTVARLADDKFLVLLDGLPHTTDALYMVDKIHAVLAVPMDLPAGGQVHVAATIGIASYAGDKTLDAEMLLSQADAAMYETRHRSNPPAAGAYRARTSHQRLQVP